MYLRYCTILWDFKKVFYYTHIHIHVGRVCMCVWAMMSMWWSEDNVWELFFSFHVWTPNLFVRLGRLVLYLLSHPASLSVVSYNFSYLLLCQWRIELSSYEFVSHFLHFCFSLLHFKAVLLIMYLGLLCLGELTFHSITSNLLVGRKFFLILCILFLSLVSQFSLFIVVVAWGLTL